jgi:translation initiation factor 2 subunit 3
MVKGTSVVDCAILVVDSRKDYLQVQTLEHLAILEILGVHSIIIVQNKIDLVTQEQCLKHYNMLRVELKRTIAEDAPIIPCSAQQGIKIETVQLYLWNMVHQVLQHSKPLTTNVFSVIRSFDINKPACTVDDLKGGVLGGTVIGDNGYNIGEILEIRPGLIKADGTHQPLTTKVLSIFSERDRCTGMVRGGLYGIGTNLDPTLTKGDRLVGSLVGREGELPEVVTELKMTVIQLRHNVSGDINDKVPKIKKGRMYQLIIGSNVVKAIAQEITKHKKTKTIVMKLLCPVCIIDKKCLIYSCESSKTQLIGFGVMEAVEEKRPVFVYEYEYMVLLPENIKAEKIRAAIPVPKMSRENRNMIWSNMVSFCQVVNREPEHVSTYLIQEMCIRATICADGLRIVKSRLDARKLQSVLKKYIKEKIMCDQCKGLETKTSKNPVTRHWEVHCIGCGSTNSVL